MKTRWFWISAILILTSCLGACSFSFRAPQLEFLSGLVFGDRTAVLEDAPWSMTWLGEVRPMYAVNVSGQILFANESGDFVQFDGRQVVRSDNLLPGTRMARIESTNTGLRYVEDSLIVSQDVCVDWVMSAQSNPSEAAIIYRQTCGTDADLYVNEIHLNELNEITKLIFKIHPQYPSLLLQLDIS